MKMTLNKKLTLSFLVVILISVGVIAVLIHRATVYNFWDYLHGGPGRGMGGMMREGGMSWFSIISKMNTPERRFIGELYSSLKWGVLVAGTVGLVLSAYLSSRLTNPLKNLSVAAKAISNGDLTQRVPVKTHDEIGEVAISFNEMVDSLEKNEQLRNRFLADIAHELRTPLTLIQGNLESILDGVVDPDKEHIASIYDESIRLARLVQDLRDLSLAEAGHLQLEKQRTDLVQLIQSMAQALKTATEDRNILFQLDCPEKAIVLADPDRVNQILYNLATNSIRYSPADGIITVGVEEKGRFYRVYVSDNGPGIPKEDQPFIFNHFYRADKSRTKSSGGSGLGLAIAKQLVEAHGGTITLVTSTPQGTTISFTLPK